MNPRELSVKDFTYMLPEEKIASFPLEERDQSKLLVFDSGNIQEDVYHNIASHLPAGSMLVFNNTRVVEARIIFQKPTGGMIEIFALEPDDRYTDIATAMESTGKVWWKCLIGGAGKWKHGQVLQKTSVGATEATRLEARITERTTENFIVELSWEPGHLSFAEILHLFGMIPIPPYLKRESTTADQERYQTIYAKTDGSVAAPTAGLHFTEAVFKSLSEKNIQTDFVTLHVGAGTFMPVKSATVNGHQMHAEFLQVDRHFIKKLASCNYPVIAVGTTSLRTLESLYWMGVKCCLNPAIDKRELEIKQWEAYEELQSISVAAKVALEALANWMDLNNTATLIARTSILIAPPYRARLVQGLITNFHQPNSTLLLLVAALIGPAWTKVYDYALEHNFRFLSYGDGCLLFV